MIIAKHGALNKKEKVTVKHLLREVIDVYSDFYITSDNLRYSLRENTHLLFEALKKGDLIAFSEQDGVACIFGWSDKNDRKYLRILARNDKAVYNLIKVLDWHIDCPLYIKIKKNNPIRKILETNNFIYKGNRGSEILLCKSPIINKG